MHRDEKAVTAGDGHGSNTPSTSFEYCPLEDRENQRTVILAYRKRLGSVTAAEAQRWYLTMSPASWILELQHQCHPIITRRDPAQKCRFYRLTAVGGGGDVID
jgi:hypothetical protein